MLPVRSSLDFALMEFAAPGWLWMLALLPVWGGWRWWHARKRGGLRFGAIRVAAAAPRGWRSYVTQAPLVLRVAALALCTLAMARPQIRDVTVERYAEGVDIMLVLDTSTSMRAEDFRPNRLEAARVVGADFVRGRVSDRIGLIVFAGRAYTQAPLTLDYPFLLAMLEEVHTGMIEDGTAIGTALATAVNRLKDTEAESKVIILLTDGQNNRGEVDPVTASELAAALGVRIYAIGVGTRGQAPYPVDDPYGVTRRQMINVEIDEDMLRSVSANTGGEYFRAVNSDALRAIYDRIGEMEQTRIETLMYTDFQERYQRYLWPGLLLVVLELVLSNILLRRFP